MKDLGVEGPESLKVKMRKIFSTVLPLLAFQLFVAGCAMNDVTVLPIRALPANAVHPVWSPDGKSLAFESDLAGNWDIWTIRRDGTGLKQITHEPSNERFPSWSPDGARLAYASDRGGNWDIWSMNLDGTDHRQLTVYNGLDIAPVWSPDGKRIAFVSSRSMDVLVWVMDADGGNVQGMPNIRCGDWVSAWSPDARSVAAVSSMRGRSDIWLIDTRDRTIKQLTQKTETRRDFLPAWSPDGTRIAFVSERNGHRDVWVMDRDGNNERRLGRNVLGTREMKYNVDKQVFDGLSFLYLSWSPDGRDLAFTRVNEAGRGEIAVMQVAQQTK
ncbi:MAG TPA: DPP IV N-terminal domain-containing protein [Nitrospiria bacterium]|jgi:Tol biopolymer transport system component|nr:DPP IV N-terminal domain-containing protein [Nitrospiria bacterium]